MLKDVKGNNVDEKIYRALEYDLNSFIHINDKEEWNIYIKSHIVMLINYVD